MLNGLQMKSLWGSQGNYWTPFWVCQYPGYCCCCCWCYTDHWTQSLHPPCAVSWLGAIHINRNWTQISNHRLTGHKDMILQGFNNCLSRSSCNSKKIERWRSHGLHRDRLINKKDEMEGQLLRFQTAHNTQTCKCSSTQIIFMNMSHNIDGYILINPVTTPTYCMIRIKH